jgi:NitT/TauT family transport system substrate-binding protein
MVTTRILLSAITFTLVTPCIAADDVNFGTTSNSDATSIVSYIAMEKQLFKTNGLNLNWIVAGSAAKAVQQTVAASLDLSIAATDVTLRAIDNDAKLEIVASTVGAAPFRVVAAKDITKWSDFKGKTISVGGPKDQTLYFLRVIARQNGLNDSDYDLVYAGTTPARVAQLKSGAIAAAVLTNPNDIALLGEGYHDLGSAPDYVPTWAQNNMFVNKAWSTSHPDVAVRFIRAFLGATNIFYDPGRRGEVIDVMKKYTGADDQTSTQIYKFYQEKSIISRDGVISKTGIEAVADTLRASGDLSKSFDASSALNDTYLRLAKGGTP